MGTNLRMAMRALTQNKMQALLTLLGMSVGVAMVVIVSGLGRGAQLRIESQIEASGPTRITIKSGNLTPAGINTGGRQDTSFGEEAEGAVGIGPLVGDQVDVSQNEAVMDARRRMEAVRPTRHLNPPTPLGAAEIELLSHDVEHVIAVAGSVTGNASVDPDAGLRMRVVRVQGYAPAWPEMDGWDTLEGELPDGASISAGAPEVLLGPGAAAKLWPDGGSPIGRILPVKGEQLRVVGVIDAKEDDKAIIPSVYVPLSLAQTLLERDNYDSITVRTSSVAVTSAAAEEIGEKLRVLHQLPDDTFDDFRIESQSVSALPSMGSNPGLVRAVHANTLELEKQSWEEMAKSLRQAGRTFTLLLAGAAAVSLAVGGVGVMNIMLVSVAARTREIGLRMALGARANDVMIQFLVEAVTLAVLGGLFGLMLGGIGLMITEYGLHWATAVSPWMLLLAFAMAAITGVVFGIAPARRAALLDPVVALRAE
ncbi:putative ABC transport system permease protein [Altererythrobacter atlanticus]|nr:ABC transporter permease [Croceibacterium atlanticum]MBB5731392.1 putative ABC transport system permease protein [Croceibacterium atlanticum]